jgi:predicted enzyme related to lactoylglutathione lyase
MANEPKSPDFKQGDICHVELPVKDRTRAKAFYGEVFGWKFTDVPGMDYTLFETPGRVIGGGLFSPSERMPEKVINYMLVESIDQSAKKVTALGGKTLSPKIDVPGHGTLMQILDSEGNLIALWEASAESKERAKNK